MIKRFLHAAGAVALLLAGGASGATPASGTIGPTAPVTTWQGQSYVAAANVGGTEGLVVPCTSPLLDPANVLCDHFSVTVDVAASYWNTNSGGLSVSISW